MASKQSAIFEDIPDGAGNTLLLIQKAPITPWAKPEDLSFDEAVELLTSPIDINEEGVHVFDFNFFHQPTTSRKIAWVDGSVSNLYGPLPEELARAILTADGGEAFDRKDLDVYVGPRLDYGRCVGCTLFVLTCLAPLPRFIAELRRRAGNGHLGD